MVPLLVVVGLVLGFLPNPWPLVGLAAIAVGAPLLFVATGVIEPSDVENVLGVLALAALNAGVGVVVVRAMLRIGRALR